MAVRRMRNLEFGRAFETWLEAMEEERVMGVAVARLLNMGVARCFNAWLEKSEEQSTMKRQLAAAAGRLVRPALAASLTHWRHSWEAAVRFAAEGGLLGRITALEEELRAVKEELQAKGEEMEEGHRQRIEAMARRAVTRMRNGQLLRGWEAWVEQWAEERRGERLLSGFVVRLMNAKLSNGWNSWLDAWEEASRQQRMMRAFVGRLLNRQLAASWETWAHGCAADEAMSRKLSSFLGRVMNLGLARGWGAWMDAWEEQRRQRALLASAVARMRRPELAASFGHWRSDWCKEQPMVMLEGGEDTGSVPKEEAMKITEELRACEEERQAALEEVKLLKEAAARSAAAHAAAQKRSAEECERLENQMDALRAKGDELGRKAKESADALAAELHRAAQQEEEESAARGAMHGLRAELASMTEKSAQLQGQLAASEVRAGMEGKRADQATELAKRLQRQMESAGLPLAEQEKRALISEMNGRMEELVEAVGTQSAKQIRELTQLVALRDRQLAHAAASPGSTKGSRLLDMRPLQNGTLLATGAAGAAASSGLLVCVPSTPQADAWARGLSDADDEERRRQLQMRWVSEDARELRRPMSGGRAAPGAGAARRLRGRSGSSGEIRSMSSADLLPTLGEAETRRPFTAGSVRKANTRAGLWRVQGMSVQPPTHA